MRVVDVVPQTTLAVCRDIADNTNDLAIDACNAKAVGQRIRARKQALRKALADDDTPRRDRVVGRLEQSAVDERDSDGSEVVASDDTLVCLRPALLRSSKLPRGGSYAPRVERAVTGNRDTAPAALTPGSAPSFVATSS